MTLSVTDIRTGRRRAELRTERGDYEGAERILGELLEGSRASASPGVKLERTQCLTARANLEWRCGRPESALAALNEVEALAGQLSSDNQRTLHFTLWQQRANLRIDAPPPHRDLVAARADLESLRALGLFPWSLDILEGRLAFAERNFELAAEHGRRLSTHLRAEGWPGGAARAQLTTARALVECGRFDEAGQELAACAAPIELTRAPDLVAVHELLEARVLSARGEHEAAWALASTALDGFARQIRHFRSFLDQQRFLLDKLDHHRRAFEVAAACPGATGIWRAWSVAERTKGFSLCQMVANADIALFEDVDPAQIARLNQLEEALDGAERAAGSLASGPAAGPAGASGDAAAALADLLAEREALLRSLFRDHPRWAALRAPPVPDVAAIVGSLGDTWSPLSYFWAHDPEESRLHALFVDAEGVPRRVESLWTAAEVAALRSTRDTMGATTLRAQLARLIDSRQVQRLLPPAVRNCGAPGSRLLISPHGLLCRLPLHALPSPGLPRLVETRAVQYVPTLSLVGMAYDTSSPARAAPPTQVTLIGSPEDSFGSQSLPEVVEEIESIAAVWRSRLGTGGAVRALILGPSDTLDGSALPLREWTGSRAIHLACHGQFPEDRPFDAALLLGASKLRMSELFGVRLDGAVVALSACDLGRTVRRDAEIELPDDEWLGLYLPLFHAGGESLLVSLWPAASRAAGQFMKRFHAELAADQAPSDACAAAARAAIATADWTTTDLHWSNWYLVGVPRCPVARCPIAPLPVAPLPVAPLPVAPLPVAQSQ